MSRVGKSRQDYWTEMYNIAFDVLKDLSPRNRHKRSQEYADRKTAELFG